MSRTQHRALIVLTACLALVAAGCTGAGNEGASGNNEGTSRAGRPSAQAGDLVTEKGYAGLVERVAPSVVTIRTGGGLGSGVVYKPDVVVTNAHVVGGTKSVTVVFADGRQSRGEVIGTDTVTDLALIRTERDGLPVPDYREQLPRAGDRAVAIGSPLGFENSVTAGVVSGLHREIPGSASRTQSLVDLIQTDASISPGNSGGALLDVNGRVIGINEAYIPPKTGAVSLGFAIPSSTVIDTADQLLADGEAVHPYLGVSLAPLTPSLAREFDVGTDSGAVVTGVDRNGPAAAAGVRQGDVIVRLAGSEVASVEDVLAALRGTEPGQQITMQVVREGGQQRLTVTVDAREG